MITLFMAAWALAASMGCSQRMLRENVGLEVQSKDEVVYDVASRVVAVWHMDVATDSNGRTRKGVVGNLIFLNANDQPTAVDGDIRIFLFDDRGTEQENAMPIWQFDYAPEAWQGHLCETGLGTGYTVFLPHPDVGVVKTTCAMRVRLRQKDRPDVFSEMAYVKIP